VQSAPKPKITHKKEHSITVDILKKLKDILGWEQNATKPKVLTKEQKERLLAKKSPLQKRLKLLKARFGDKVYIRIFKKSKELEVWVRPRGSKVYKLLKIYNICYYSGKLGPKLKEGDGQAPEGFYKVYKGSLNPHSSYHLSFNLGFPNAYDKAHHRTGSYLMVHGNCVSIGCYAMGDKNIEQIYKLVKSALYKQNYGVHVDIFPFRMSRLNMAKVQSNKWFKFWKNLKEGYDYFEKYKIPPKVRVKNKRYSIKK